jgi:hypothetical protein
MYTNVITAKVLNGVRIPIVMENDLLALQLALMQNGREDTTTARVVRIKDTVHLGRILLSQAFFDEIKDDSRFEILGQPALLNFDTDGNFYPFE